MHESEHTFLKGQSTETRSVGGASFWKLCGGLGVDEIKSRAGYREIYQDIEIVRDATG